MGIHLRKMKSAKAIYLMEGNRIANPSEEYNFAVGMLLVSKEREDGMHHRKRLIRFQGDLN